uniref:Helicase C-terminal domain-containing protein n=1 Tax=Strongyloides venezuelensis TaxID=75913 RepID=A0A0K0FJ69_STRVS
MCGVIIVAENEIANSFRLPSRKTLVLLERNEQVTFCEYYQEYREKALNALRSGNINVLVVTNVLARAMDISDLDNLMIVDLLMIIRLLSIESEELEE